MSKAFDIWKSYDPVLATFTIGIALVGFVALLLGPYRFPPEPLPGQSTTRLA